MRLGTSPSSLRAFRTGISDRVQHVANLGRLCIRGDTWWRVSAGDIKGPLPCVRIGAILHPTVFVALADGARLPEAPGSLVHLSRVPLLTGLVAAPPRTPQRNRNELGEITVNRKRRKPMSQQENQQLRRCSLRSGRRGRRFESCHSDHCSCHSFYWLFLIAGGSRVNRRFLIRSGHKPAFSRRGAPEACQKPCSLGRREQGMPGARCTRGLVCNSAKQTRTRAYRYSRKHSGIPCAVVLRLMPRSLRRRIRLASVTAGLLTDRIPVGLRIRHRQLGTSNGCRDHTVLPYASAPFVSCAGTTFDRSRTSRPAITLASDASASTTSRLAFVTIAIRPSCRDETVRK